MLHGRDVEAGVQPRVSTGRTIHAVPSITPSPREGIEDRAETAWQNAFQSRWPWADQRTPRPSRAMGPHAPSIPTSRRKTSL